MGDLVKIFQFAWPYLRRYWLRFVLGIFFGFLFGLSNGLTLGSISLMLNRLGDPVHVSKSAEIARKESAERESQEPPASRTFHATMKQLSGEINAALDPWLPLAHHPVTWRQLLGGFLLLPLVAAIRGATNYATTYFMAWAGMRISNDIKGDVFRKINTLSLDYFHRRTTAEMLSRINDDTGAVNSCLRLGLSDLIKEPSTILILFVGLLLLDWKLTLIALGFAPLCVIPTIIITRRIKAQGRQNNVASINQAGIALESFQNIRVTKAYELADTQAGLFDKAGRRANHFVLKTVQSRAMLNPIIETLNAFGMGAVLLYAISFNVSVMTLGSFLFALVLFYQPFKKLSGVQIYFTQSGLAIERLMALFNEKPSVAEAEHPLPLGEFSRSIEFRKVGFTYGDGPVLEDINFTLRRGQRLGLAGESGSGKSSLLNLLFRFYDSTGGEIEIDGIPITQVRIADLRGQLALVSQDILLFNNTVAENIAFGKSHATREDVIAAAREAHAHDFIETLPKGYDTPLGERGLRLSGGQRQRIAIARAFVRNAPILVLDEATASLDSQSESEVQKAIDHLAENRTVICVAHRLSTLRSMDQILVMQKGRVVERGGFDELLHADGIFTAMAARQSIFPAALAAGAR